MNQVQTSSMNVQMNQNEPVQNEEMNSFEFKKAYYQAIQELPEYIRLSVYDAIAEYFFFGVELNFCEEINFGLRLIKNELEKEKERKKKQKETIKEKKNQKKKTTKKEKEINKEKERSSFVRFWMKYPKKQKKQECIKWFEKNNPTDELLELMLSQLEFFKKTKQWENPQFIPLPITWLNQRRWEDELSIEEEKYDETENLRLEVEKLKAEGKW